MMPASTIIRSDTALDTIVHGDCIKVMGRMASAAVDFVLTDPPYIAHYRSRTGRCVINDDNGAWLQPAFTQMYRLLKPGCFCVSFYGWSQADRFIAAWRKAGFRMVGHLVFRKKYASSARFLRYLRDSDEAGRVFRFEAGHPFRFESGHHSDLKVAGVASPGGLLG